MLSEHSHANNHKFPKKERLQSKKLIARLFEQGRSFSHYPFKVFYLVVDAQDLSDVQFLISVPKRKFKKAVDRNLLKRRTKEAFRLQKNLIYPIVPPQKTILIAYIYISDQIMPFNLIQSKLNNSLLRLSKMITHG